MIAETADFDCHKGHRIYVGGRRDGDIDHLIFATPSDYPLYSGTCLREGTRHWYERDLSGGAHVVYRYVGAGVHAPQVWGR